MGQVKAILKGCCGGFRTSPSSPALACAVSHRRRSLKVFEASDEPQLLFSGNVLILPRNGLFINIFPLSLGT